MTICLPMILFLKLASYIFSNALQLSILYWCANSESEEHYNPFSFNFVFILQAKNANVVANVGSLYFKVCCYYGWRFF
jgi:hypothetical protein